jgi:DNA-binding NarL/FixJ family response regulator
LRRKTNYREASLARILIVDDHPTVISGCRALLGAESGVDVIDAPNGAAGFAAFFKAKPDVTLSRVIPASSFYAAFWSGSRERVLWSSA